MMPAGATVECYSGHIYAQEPRTLVWQGQRHEVEAVVARWRLPEGPAFRVRTSAGALFDLHFDEGESCWAVHPREPQSAPGADEPRAGPATP